MKYLITGAAGFIGFHLSKRLLGQGNSVIGVDNLNEYYDVNLKKSRLNGLKGDPEFTFHKLDLVDQKGIEKLFSENDFDYVVNLAAQAGVRYSLTNPHSYVDSNVVGFLNILEGCRNSDIKHLVFASSSSVYGANTMMPFSVHHNVDHPISLYAATKKQMNLWPTPIQVYTDSHVQVSGFLLFTALWDVRIWLCFVYQSNPGKQADRYIQPEKDEERFHLYR